MLAFEVRKKTQTVGERKGQTVYYASPKTQQKMTHKELVDHIVRETSLSAGDVSNALISLKNVVCEALRAGGSVDLADLGSLRLVVTSKMMDKPEDVTVAKALNTPKIQFTPKADMRDAAQQVSLSIDSSRVVEAKPGEDTGTEPEEPGTEDPGTDPGTGGDDTAE